jgi:hypothetical protein
MLPDAELEETVRNDDFGADAEDAYGEIANIIAGVYTQVFEEQYSKSLGFVKTKLEVMVPAKVDPDSDDVLPAQPYYVQIANIQFSGKELGKVLAAFPASLFDLQALASPAQVDAAVEQTPIQASSSTAPATSGGVEALQHDSKDTDTSTAASVLEGGAADVCNMLIFSETEQGGAALATILKQLGYGTRILRFRDNATDYLPGEVELVFLVMEQVSEQGLSLEIKIKGAAPAIPLVAAAPVWKRSTVLKAVRYGADNILITPAGVDDVQEMLDATLQAKMAA